MTPLVIESWLWYACVVLVVFCRLISRRMTLGAFKRFQADDYGMLAVLCFYTTLIATINIVRNTNSNLLPPGFDRSTLTPQVKAEREYGSKLILVVEQTQCVTIWGAKLCLLTLYLRLTSLRWENIGIKILTGYVVVAFIVMEILYFGVWCQPFHNYWAVPTPNVQCDAATNHLITNATFNLSSDVAMIAIALPMFLRLRLPWQKKAPMVLVFSLGIFVILAAILNKVYSFTQPFGELWTYWYVRESSTALLVANLPFVWGLWRKLTGLNGDGASHWGSEQLETADFSTQNGSTREEPLSNFLAEWESKDNQLNNGSRSGFPPFGSKADANEDRSQYKGRSDFPLPSPLSQKAVTVDLPMRETVRRDSDSQSRRGTISTTSTVLGNCRSAGSFV